jgi:hypothetical protein
VHNQAESYRVEEAKRLLTQTPTEEYAISPCSSRGDGVDTSAEDLKAAKWRLALDVFLRADENQTPNGFHRGVHYSVSLPEFCQRELGAARPQGSSHET